MPQNGLHGLVGLAAARWIAPRAPVEAAVPLALAVTMGAMLPDIDLYPTSILYLAGHEDMVQHIHRTLTHSIFLAGALAGIGFALRARLPRPGWALIGLALGLGTHIALDTVFWFSSVDLFYPLSHLPAGAAVWKWPVPGTTPGDHALLPVLDIWNVNPKAGEAGLRLPVVFGNRDFIGNALLAGDLLAFALYLAALRRIALRDPSAKVHTRRMKRWVIAGCTGFAVLLGTAVKFSEKSQNIAALTPVLLAFLPYAWSQTVRQRRPLADWARSGRTE